MYDLCKLEEEGKCSDHQDCAAYKKSARDIRITNILTLAETKTSEQSSGNYKVKDRTETRVHQEGTNWDMDNATKDKCNATETVTKESIHAESLHNKCNNSNKKDGKQSKDKFIKSSCM